MRGEWGLVGRAEELELLKASLAGAEWRAVVLSGAAGVGKTRLAGELVWHAAERGRDTAWVSGTRSMASVPFGAFAHLLPPTVTAASSPLEVLRRARDELARRGADGALVLGVDDAHLLDAASAGLAHLLAATATAFVVATVRRGEPAPDAIRSLWKDGLAERVELQPLSRREVGELLSAVLGGQVETATQHRLWDASRGNVLFVRELVLIGVQRGTLAERHGVWTWRGELAVGARVTELVEERLAELNRQQRSAMEVLAVGEPLPTSLFAEAVGVRVLHALEDRLLVTISLDDRRSTLRLTHPLYAETLRGRIGALRRQVICRQLATALAGTGARGRDDVLRLSLWQLEGGTSTDPAVLLAAARRARSLFEHALAERLARAAAAVGGGVEAEILLADALYWQSRHDEAQAVLDTLDPDAADPAALVEWGLTASANAFWGQGDAQRAEEVLLAAERRLLPGSERDQLTAQRSSIILFHGRPAEALAAVEPALGRAGQSAEARVRVAVAAVVAWATLGQAERAIRVAAETLRDVPSMLVERPLLFGELMVAQVVGYFQAGRYAEMEALAATAYEHAVAAHAHDLRGLWALLLGRAALARGVAETACRRLREASAVLREHDITGSLPWALACWARAAALLGDLAEAGAALAECERSRRPAVRVFDAELLLAQAWVAAAGGEHTEARRLACLAAGQAAAQHQGSVELEAWHDAVRLGEPGLLAQLRRLGGPAEHRLAPVYVEHAAALAARDGPSLDHCAQRFADLGAPLLAAEAAAEAAERYRQAGRRGAEFAALGRSRTWAQSCEGACSPTLRRASGLPSLASLTGREQEVAELAAHGLSNREIAGRLVLSLRTVGNHLNHVYAKLEITGRTELTVVPALHADEPGRS